MQCAAFNDRPLVVGNTFRWTTFHGSKEEKSPSTKEIIELPFYLRLKIFDTLHFQIFVLSDLKYKLRSYQVIYLKSMFSWNVAFLNISFCMAAIRKMLNKSFSLDLKKSESFYKCNSFVLYFSF